jgi:hypothetical protein
MAEDMNASWVMASFNQGNYAQALSKYERLANDNPDGKSSAMVSATREVAAAAGCALRGSWVCGGWLDAARCIVCVRKSASEAFRAPVLTAVDCAGYAAVSQ